MLAREDQKTRQKLAFLNSIRIAILGALFFASVIIMVFFNTSFSITPVAVSLLAAIAIHILCFPLANVLRYQVLLFIQLNVDILIITLLVYFSGGIISPFYFLYILPIIVAALFLSRRGTIYIATLSFIVFGILSDLLYLKVIPFSPGYEVGDISLGTFIYNLFMSFVAFSSLAVLSSYYFERIRKTGAELKSAQESLQDLIMLNNSVMERMENGFITTDINGRIISYNRQAAQFLSITAAGNVFELLLSKEDIDEILKISQPSKRYYIEKRINQRDLGISVSIIEKISPYEKLLVLLITDLTEIKKIERRLKEKENLALMGEMIAGIAHEIRNPLASISGSVQFLTKELNLAKEYQDLMNIIVKESQRLSTSIEEILSFSKTTPLKLQRFDLSQVVEEIIGMAALNYQRIQFRKQFSAGNMVAADTERIKQLIWNIITNAIKAVGEKGTIDICIFQTDHAVNLSIKDNGKGMDKTEVAKIFTPFYSKFSSGVGLGMFIVKRIVDIHGFKIDVKSGKDKGTEVTVCFSEE